MEKLNIIYKKIDELVPYENNPRNNDDAVRYVKESIKQFGFKVPIVVDKDNIVIAGHTRLKASKELGIDEVPVIIADDLTEDQVKAFRLADNKVSEQATWDYNILDYELENIDMDMENLGFISTELDANDFGTDFELADGDKSEICQMTFTLHEKQKELIEYAMDMVKNDIVETFGNTNSNGNKIYEVIRQWAEQKK